MTMLKFELHVTECCGGPPGRKGWMVFGNAQGRYIQRGTVLAGDNGEEYTVFGVCRMRMIEGPSKWGWVVDRQVPVGTTLTEQGTDSELELGEEGPALAVDLRGLRGGVPDGPREDRTDGERVRVL